MIWKKIYTNNKCRERMKKLYKLRNRAEGRNDEIDITGIAKNYGSGKKVPAAKLVFRNRKKQCPSFRKINRETCDLTRNNNCGQSTV